MGNLDALVNSLKKERDKLNQAIAALETVGSSSSKRSQGKHTISAAGRARIAAAQRKRWALFFKEKKK